MTPARRKSQMNVRISDAGRDLLERLGHYYGLPMSGVVELLVRDRAREVGILAHPRGGGPGADDNGGNNRRHQDGAS